MTDRDKAIAALDAGIWVEYSDVQKAWYFDIPHSVQTAWGDTPIKALAAAADALGLEPAPQTSPLTMEMVEKELRFVEREGIVGEGFVGFVMTRLRQQMGGGQG